MIKRIIEWEDQHASLELCQRLQELGASTGTCFMWVFNKDLNKWIIFANSPLANILDWKRKAPAYNCAELGELLPDNCYSQKDCGTLPIEWSCENEENICIADTEANARAQMLIHLIKNKLIEIKD